jgi:hypothetical protein
MSDRMTAEQDAEKMPPLPTPEVGIWGAPDGPQANEVVRTLFSHHQMREYGQACYRAATLAAQARTAEVLERAVEAFQPFVNCNFTYFRGKVLGGDSKTTRADVDRARASITELQQHLGKRGE